MGCPRRDSHRLVALCEVGPQCSKLIQDRREPVREPESLSCPKMTGMKVLRRKI